MYVPSTLNNNNSKTTPLVVVIHGCTQSANMIASETGWNKLADSLNFIVIYPEQKQINNAAKCYNYFLGFKAKKDKGEVASIKQMVDFSRSSYFIDSSKIFITGFSAGGGISNAMLNAYPELFNAGALFAAPSDIFNPNSESPNLQPKVAIIQGESDRVVPKSNAERLLQQWLKKNQLSDENYDEKKDYLNNPLLTARLYYTESKETKIITIYAETIKHKILITPGKSINTGGKMDTHTVDINFHSTYWIAQFFGLIKH